MLGHARVARSCPNRWVASELLSVFSVARRRPSHSESIGVVRVAVSSESPLGGVTGVRVSCALFELLKSLVNRSVSSETLGGVRVSCELFELLKSLVKSESPGGVRVARRPLSRSAASESNVGIRVARWCPSRSAASGSLGRIRITRQRPSRSAAFESLCGVCPAQRRPSQTVASALLNGVRVAWYPSGSAWRYQVDRWHPSRLPVSGSLVGVQVAR